jgi:N-acetyl-gamma-glutamyl-phosphate reductase
VLGTNFCDVSVAVEGKKLIVMAAIDNLVKGMAGQAIQNLNLMCGFPEERGLMIPGTRPY